MLSLRSPSRNPATVSRSPDELPFQAPARNEADWIATVPGKGWSTLFRLYRPLAPWFDKSWRPEEIELVR